jgi:PilZ domain
MFIERRREPREALALPLQLADGSAAVTRDISPSGMYLEINCATLQLHRLFFEMHLAEAGMRLTAEGEVLRIDARLGGAGLALKLRQICLERTG